MLKMLWALALAIPFAIWPGAVWAATEVSLGAAKCFALLPSGAGATLTLSGANSTIRGQVGLGRSAVQDFTTGQIIGQFVVDPAANDTRANTVIIDGGTVKASLTVAVSDAAAAAAAIAAMPPTQKFGRITANATITATAGVNVVSIASLALSGATLTLSGSASDVFYLNMAGDVSLAQSSQILLNGVPAANVIFNLGRFSLQVSGGSFAAGTFLAFGKATGATPSLVITNATLSGAILAASRTISLSAGANVTPTCIAPSETTAITAPADTWSFVRFWDAFCANGASTGIGVNLQPSSNKVLIYMEAGGACWSDLTCYILFSAVNFTTGYGPAQFQGDLPTLKMAGGFFDRASVTNPFRDYNYIYVPYCTGDAHIGRNVVQIQGFQGTPQQTSFLGGSNFKAYLARLVATFPKATQVVLAGSSFGGMGAVVNWGETQNAFASAQVDMIDDSGTFMPASEGAGFVKIGAAAWNVNAAVPAACGGCLASGLAELYAYYAKSFPKDRGALLSYQQDSVLPTFYDIDESQFIAGLDGDLLTYFKPTPNLRYFVDAASGHVLWFTPQLTSNGVSVESFVNKMVTGATWSNVGPTP